MKRKYVFSFFLIFCALFSACNNQNKTTQEDTEVNYGTINTETQADEPETHLISSTTGVIRPGEEIEEKGINTGHNSISYDIGSGIFMDFPLYYQQDYADVEFGHSTVAKQGNLLTCLSMIDTYLSNTFINPKEFIGKYKNHIQADGSISKTDIMNEMANNAHSSYTTRKFDLDEVIKSLDIDRSIILLEINHPSIYCDTSTYMILLSNDTKGNLEVRDPNLFNIEKFNKSKESSQVLYSVTNLCVAAGNSSDMYVFQKGVPFQWIN